MDKEKVIETFLNYIYKEEDEGRLEVQSIHGVKNYLSVTSEPDENNKVQVLTLAFHAASVHRTEHDVSNSPTGDPVADAFQQGIEAFYADDVYLDLKNKTHLDLTEEAGITKETHPDKGFDCFDNLIGKYFVDKPETPKDGQFTFGHGICLFKNMQPHTHIITSEKNPDGVVKTLIYNVEVPYVRMVEHQQQEPYRGLSSKSVSFAACHSLEKLRTQKGHEVITEEVGITYDMIYAGTWADLRPVGVEMSN